ncbi:MAG: hypothetical protein IKQ41_11900 [Clostridia bacterium]|nr:hypothetical protein [Clostridia bacterium]
MTLGGTFVLCVFALLLSSLGAAFFARGGLAAGFALEGIMLLGGLAGLVSSGISWWAALLIAGAAGMVFSALLALLQIHLKGDPVIGGIALTFLAAALAMILARLLGGVSYNRKTFEWTLNGEAVSVFLPLALAAAPLTWLLMYHTRFGLRLRLCGEERNAAENAGVRIQWTRWRGALLGGFLGGAAGVAALIALGGGWTLKQGVGGMGFLAAAAMICGQGKPWRILLYALMMAALQTGALMAVEYWPAAPQEAFRLIPFVLALGILCLKCRRNEVPGETARALGLDD